MSVKVMSAVFDCEMPPLETPSGSVTPPVSKLILLALADCANDHGESAYPGRETLRRKTGLSSGVISKALLALRQAGYIKAQGRSRWNTVNHAIILPKLASPGGETPKGDTSPGEVSINHVVLKDTSPGEVNPSLNHQIKPSSAQKPRAATNETYQLAVALATVCKMDLAANKGRLLREAKTLLSATPPATPQLLETHYNGNPAAFWKRNWRSRNGQPPTPAAIRETWGQWTAAQDDFFAGTMTPAQAEADCPHVRV